MPANARTPALNRLRDLSLALADHLPDKDARRVRACNRPLIEPSEPLAQYCRSPYCLACIQHRRQVEANFLHSRIQALHTAQPIDTYLGTFTIRDCHVAQLREHAVMLSRAWTRLHRKLTRNCSWLRGWHRSIEIEPSGSNSRLENIHLHVAMCVTGGYSGRNYLSQSNWRDLWKSSAGPLFRDAKVTRRNIQTVANYSIKHDATKLADSWDMALRTPARMIERIYQVKSLPVFTIGGGIRVEHLSTDADTGLFTSQQNVRRLYREMSRPRNEATYRPIPTEE
jgi:hypothetical protein